ncbi:hypothetical protein IGI04_039929 [Brassica rapa subsp. trilocularis]|uniref:Uncharacterized protein n=1 Tax=Brassica rapa subsp. trilocularis TaxID=1813537 RepID=A0ABQ7KM83_BRACM|nr:hypothetical protein IGI04_039929 [Brassica rapa subsp. trilocularis]
MRVKGISQLRLNQDTMEIRVKELGECLGSWTSVGLSSISSVQLLGTAGGQLNPVNGAFWFGSVWASPGRLLGEPMVRVQDGSTKWVLGFGQGAGKLPECELRLSDRFAKGRKGEKPPMGGYGTAVGDSLNRPLSLISDHSGRFLHPETQRIQRKIQRVGRIPNPRPMVASSVSWKHTQVVRREGGRLDSTLKGMNSLEDGCSIETGFMEVPWKESSDGTFVMRQEVNTTGFEDESFVSGGDLSCPRSWIGSSGWTAVQGNAPVRSHDLRTSVSWS